VKVNGRPSITRRLVDTSEIFSLQAGVFHQGLCEGR
jgi:hypothetical protein